MSQKKAQRQAAQQEAKMARQRGDLVRKAVDQLADQMEARALRIPDPEMSRHLLAKAHSLRSADVLADLEQRRVLRQKQSGELGSDHGSKDLYAELGRQIRELENKYTSPGFLDAVDALISGQGIPADCEDALAVVQVGRAILRSQGKL